MTAQTQETQNLTEMTENHFSQTAAILHTQLVHINLVVLRWDERGVSCTNKHINWTDDIVNIGRKVHNPPNFFYFKEKDRW
jgi:hypothetical protein